MSDTVQDFVCERDMLHDVFLDSPMDLRLVLILNSPITCYSESPSFLTLGLAKGVVKPRSFRGSGVLL
jgi:hypothetical protein